MNCCPLIPADWQLPRVLRFRLGTGPGQQRALQHDGQLLLVLHEVPQHRDRNRIGQLFWRDSEGNWRSTLAADGAAALDRHLGSFAAQIDYLATDFEEAQDSKDFFELISKLAPLVRTTRNMHSALKKAREIEREDPRLINWRDEAYALVRRVELLQADANSALDFDMAQQAELQAEASHQMAVSAHRLNVLAAFFFPVMTLSAIFGMQFRHGLESWDDSHQPWLLLGVLGLGLLLGSALTVLITRPARRPRGETDKREA